MVTLRKIDEKYTVQERGRGEKLEDITEKVVVKGIKYKNSHVHKDQKGNVDIFDTTHRRLYLSSSERKMMLRKRR